MKITTWVGVAVFLVGILIMHAYIMYPLFNPEVEESTMEATTLFGMRIGIAMMAIGAAILIITMSVERYKEWKKMKEEISEEELRP